MVSQGHGRVVEVMWVGIRLNMSILLHSIVRFGGDMLRKEKA